MGSMIRFSLGVFALIVIVKLVDSIEDGFGFTVTFNGQEKSFAIRPGTKPKSVTDAGSGDGAP